MWYKQVTLWMIKRVHTKKKTASVYNWENQVDFCIFRNITYEHNEVHFYMLIGFSQAAGEKCI